MDNFLVIIGINMVLFWVSVAYFLSILKSKNKLAQYKISIEASVDDTIPMLLNNIIAEAFEEYMVLNESYRDDEYIDAEHEEKIIRGIGNIVAIRLSETVNNKLALYYNEEALNTIIGEKVYILVMNHSFEKNEVKEDKDDL